jgi:CBS domain containing-hemolysin-like protein
MVHRTQIAFVAAEESIAEAARLMQERGVQRLPVYVRDTDEVVGVVRVADVAAAYADGRTDATARDTMRDVSFDSELASISGVLERMQASGDHLVMLTDEFGSVAGLVTLEDIVEEVIGQIQSETGSEPQAEPESGGQGTAIIDGRTPLGELAEQYDVVLSFPGVQTIAGLVVRRLGRLPRVGELLRHGDLEITVVDVDARRVKSVAVRRSPPTPRRTN